jgi:His-Xaa-Ser system protein HxsD
MAMALPSELVSMDLDERSATLAIDASIYPLEALYGASYVLIDRAYVLLDRPTPDRYRATLVPKKPDADLPAQLEALIGEYANELLSCAYRHRLQVENRALIESVTMRAMAGAMGPPSLDDLESFDFTSDAFEDPLGIALSWEEKYGKKPPPAGEPPPPKKEGT